MSTIFGAHPDFNFLHAQISIRHPAFLTAARFSWSVIFLTLADKLEPAQAWMAKVSPSFKATKSINP
jgi:hypothetical protein